MSSELLTAEPIAGAGRGEGEPTEASGAGPWEQCFDLSPGRSTAVVDRGARHLYFSLAEMLLPVSRDLRALTGRPLRALLVGCDEGYLAHRLFEAGYIGHALAADHRPASIERARWIRERRGFGPEQFELRTCESPADMGVAEHSFDLVVADGRAERLGSAPGALERALLALKPGGACALICPDRLLAARALVAAGFARPTLLEPPADSERRLIAFELNLMLARPGDGAPEGALELERPEADR